MSDLQAIRDELNRLHDLIKSWRKIALREEYQGIHFATLNAIARGREPKNYFVRQKLNLPLPEVKVIPMNGRLIPNGSQALFALKCDCGQWFIPNAPNRLKCFICSKYRGKKR